MRTAVNLGRDQARRRKSAPFVDVQVALDNMEDGVPPVDEIVGARERLHRASAGLDQLDEITRRCLLAQRLDGLTCAEIAKSEGLPVTTVEKRITRGVLFLIKWMDDG